MNLVGKFFTSYDLLYVQKEITCDYFREIIYE